MGRSRSSWDPCRSAWASALAERALHMFPLHLHFTELAYLVRSFTSGGVFGYRAEDLPAPDHPQLAQFVEEGARRLAERGLLQRGIAGRDLLPPDLEALARRVARPAVGILLVRRKKDGDE